MILNTLSLPELTDLIEYKWDSYMTDMEQVMRNSGIFMLDPIPDYTGDIRRYNEFDTEMYAKIKPEGGQASLGKVQIGYTKDLTLKRIAYDMEVTYEIRKYNKYPELNDRIYAVATRCVNRLDLDLAHRITFADATSYVDLDGETVDISTGDGLALASTAHTVRGAATTYRTILANNPQFSQGSLELMEQMIVENTINQFGEKDYCMYDGVWSTDDPNTVNTIREVLQSTAKVSGPNDGVLNVYEGKYQHIISKRIATTAAGQVDTAKRKYWGLVARGKFRAMLAINEEAHIKPAMEGSNAESISTDTIRYASRMGYGIAIVSAKGFALSKGDGSA